MYADKKKTESSETKEPEKKDDKKGGGEKKKKKDDGKKKGKKFDLNKLWKDIPPMPKEEVPDWFRVWVAKYESGNTAHAWDYMKTAKSMNDVKHPTDVLKYARRLKKTAIKEKNQAKKESE